MKIKYPKSLMEPEGLFDCRITHEAYAEQFAEEEDLKNIIHVYVGDCVVDGTNFDYKHEARKLRRLAKWLLRVADWIEPQKLYYDDMKGAK